MATLNSQVSIIISYVPTYRTGSTAVSNAHNINGTNSVWPNGLPDMIPTYSGGWYRAGILENGDIYGTGSDYATALTNCLMAATSSTVNTGTVVSSVADHQMRTW